MEDATRASNVFPLNIRIREHAGARELENAGPDFLFFIEGLKEGDFPFRALFENKQVLADLMAGDNFEKFTRLLEVVRSDDDLEAVLVAQEVSTETTSTSCEFDTAKLAFSVPPELAMKSSQNGTRVISQTKRGKDLPVVDLEAILEHGMLTVAMYFNKPYSKGVYRCVVVLRNKKTEELVEFEGSSVCGFEPVVCLPYAKNTKGAGIKRELGSSSSPAQTGKAQPSGRGRPTSRTLENDEGEEGRPAARYKTRQTTRSPPPRPASGAVPGGELEETATSSSSSAPVPPEALAMVHVKAEPAGEDEGARSDDDSISLSSGSSSKSVETPARPVEARLVGVEHGSTLAAGTALAVDFPRFSKDLIGVVLCVKITSSSPSTTPCIRRFRVIIRERVLRIGKLLENARENRIKLSVESPGWRLARPVSVRVFVLSERNRANAAADMYGVVPSYVLSHLMEFGLLPSDVEAGSSYGQLLLGGDVHVPMMTAYGCQLAQLLGPAAPTSLWPAHFFALDVQGGPTTAAASVPASPVFSQPSPVHCAARWTRGDLADHEELARILSRAQPDASCSDPASRAASELPRPLDVDEDGPLSFHFEQRESLT